MELDILLKEKDIIDMADVHEPETRNYNMSQIQAKDTKPEMIVRKFLHANGFRYRLHVKDLPGKPDLVLPKYNSVIFVHGCFWHVHEGCDKFSIPQTRTEWWRKKLYRNKERDKENIEKLEELGWNVIVIWECEVAMDNALNRVVTSIKSNI